jgi:general secretion pathway protein C
MKRIPLITSLVLFVLLCLSSSYWVMQLIKPETRKVSAPEEAKPVANVDSVASLFGGVMVVDTNYQLKGLIQANPMNQSEAIIEVDGSSMKAFSVDSDVSSGSSLAEVYSHYVLLKGNGGSKRIELPKETTSSQITSVTKPPLDVPPSNSQAENKAPNRSVRGAKH